MPRLPTLEQGLKALANDNQSLEPALPELKTAKSRAEYASALPVSKTISAIRDEVLSTFDDSRIGHLISQYEFDRDEQMATLASLGADRILTLMAQGALPAQIARALKVSYDSFTEFVRLQCTPEDIKQAEQLGADSLVTQGIEDLEVARDRDEVAQARALMDVKLKIAKSMNSRYIEQKPSTAVQVNNFNGTEESNVPFLQILEPREEDLPPLKPYDAVKNKSLLPAPDIPTEYALFEPIDD